MLISLKELLSKAEAARYAVGAFNVYNLEGVKAVITAAEVSHSPVILQVHPKALDFGGVGLLKLCLTAAEQSDIPVCVHLDHAQGLDTIQQAIDGGILSVMADGSHRLFEENVALVREVVALARPLHISVEAELGRLSGTEDGSTVEAMQARMTDPDQADDFVSRTGIDCLAVCIGNVHGHYSGDPNLDFTKLKAIKDRVPVPLVLHGASGLPKEMVRRAITLGVTKINVNTDLRRAYLSAVSSLLSKDHEEFSTAEPPDLEVPDLLDVMGVSAHAMQAVVIEKIAAFGSVGQA